MEHVRTASIPEGRFALALRDSFVKRFLGPGSRRLGQRVVCLALALWVAGQVAIADSTVAMIPVVKALSLSSAHQVLVLGILAASVVCMDYDSTAKELLAIGSVLLALLTSLRGDSHTRTSTVLLMACAAKDIRLKSLVRAYATGLVAGILVALTLSSWGISTSVMTLIRSTYLPLFGFRRQGFFSYLLLASVMAIVLGWGKKRPWLPLGGACVALAAIMFVLQHTTRASLALAAFGIALVAYALIPHKLAALARRPWVRWAIAIMPLAIFCLSMDGQGPFSIASLKDSSYRSLGSTYGYAGLTGIYLLYALGIADNRNAEFDYPLLVACALHSVLLLHSATHLWLELNPTLLVLSRGAHTLMRRKTATSVTHAPLRPTRGGTSGG